MIKGKRRYISRIMVVMFMMAMVQFGGQIAVNADTSGDAYITYDSGTKTWTIGTAAVEKKVQLNASGQFLMTSFKNKLTSREYIQGTQNSDEFQITIGNTVYNGSTTGWVYDTYAISALSDTSLQLYVTFHNSVIKVTRYYVVFPSTGVIKEWSVFQNVSGSSRNFSSPYIFKQRVMQNDISNVDFNYMTGGGNFTGSWMYKTIAMTTSYARTFNSEDNPEFQTVDGEYGGWPGSLYNGTSIYDEFFVLRNRSTSEGVWLCFDYNGHWYADIGNYGTRINLSGYVSMTNYSVANNASITGPKATIGVFTGDTDDMGNTINDYFYRYLWDYSSTTISGGTWQLRRSPQDAFEATNLCRAIGGGTVHVDAYWFDREGDWNSSIATENFSDYVSYMAKSGILMKLWMPPWHAYPGSTVVKDHPEYVCDINALGFYGYPLNLANSSAKSWIQNMLDSKQSEFGTYMLRVDGIPAYPVNGSDNDMLKQSENFFDLLKTFRDNNPDATIDGCASGGETAMMEALRYVNSMQLTDGNAKHYTGYYTCLNRPISKIGAYFDFRLPGGVDNCFNNMPSNSPESIAISIKNKAVETYVAGQGLSGRWVKVYRPTLSGGRDQTYLLQKMDGNNDKACFLWSSFFPYYGQSFTIYPKGLKASTNYTVRSRLGSVASATQTGSYWMSNGFSVTNLQEGELISFNLPGVPGTGTDTTAPAAPSNTKKKTSCYAGKYGVELNWNAGSDNSGFLYYEIFKNGVSVDKVAKGTFDFITDGSINDTWRIRSADVDGNTSSLVTVSLDTGATPAPTPAPTPVPPTSYTASQGFSTVQGGNNWAYQQWYTSMAQYMLMNSDYSSSTGTYKGNEDNLYVGSNWQHPEADYDSVRKWIAPEDCRVLITGTPRMYQTGGDGVIAAIYKNYLDGYDFTKIWQTTIPGTDTVGTFHQVTTDIKKNNGIYFVVNKNGTIYFDSTIWDPKIYIGSAPHLASAEFSSTQGTNSWYYQEWNGSTYNNMTWNSSNGCWYGSDSSYPLVMSDSQHPGSNYDSVRTWQASENATIEIKGNVKMYQAGGDGIILSVYKNSQNLWNTTVSGNDTTTGVDFDFLAGVAPGDKIYFRVNRNGNYYFDSTLLDPTIIIYN